MSKQLWKRNSSTILTVMGGIGVIGTAVLAAKATPKAMKLIEEAEQEKGEKLSKWETVKTATPPYVPAIILGSVTVGSILGANILNQRSQAALTSAYALLDQTHKEYKRKTIELYGDDAERKVREEIAKDHYDEDEFDEEYDDGKTLFYDEFSQRYFRATQEDLLRAKYEINKMLVDEYVINLNELYELLGLDPVDYGEYVGWNASQMYEMFWSSWIDFRQEKFETDDGLEGYILTYTEPLPDSDEYY